MAPETGYAILSAEGFETVDEVVFAEPSDMALLGVRTIEGFGVMVDDIAHRFVATTTIVAASHDQQRARKDMIYLHRGLAAGECSAQRR